MIQRIQTVFLLAAVILQILFTQFALAHFALANYNIEFLASGFKQATTGQLILATKPLYILSWAIILLTTTAIFLYKKRILQIRFCIYNMLLNLGLIGMLVLNLSNFMKNNVIDAYSYSPILAMPIVNIILLYLAFRGIRRDELLIKVSDRLR